jgi:L-asparagine transporter-like permease
VSRHQPAYTQVVLDWLDWLDWLKVVVIVGVIDVLLLVEGDAMARIIGIVILVLLVASIVARFRRRFANPSS